MQSADRRAAYRVGAAAVLLFAVSLSLFWPGYVAFDSLAQYRQALNGTYDDWHPPVMAHLWSLFGVAGQGPMAALQLGGYWLGFGALAVVLAMRGRWCNALALLVVACWPPLLGWQPVVLKDTQMLAALLAATGLIGWWRLRERRVPVAAWAAIAALLAYALLVRANAVFGIVPLVVMLTRRSGGLPTPRHMVTAAGLALLATACIIGLSDPVNHRLFGAARSQVERTQPTYDLAGIAVRSGDPAIGLPRESIEELRRQGCVRPYFWDPLGEASRCEAEVAPLRTMATGRLYATLALAVVRHPFDYAAHRLAHLNSTWRWLVPLRWPGAAPPEGNEPSLLGLGTPGRIALGWQRLATWLVEMPLGWPVFWVMLALARLPAAVRGSDAASRLAAALLVSALALEGSFAMLSIASDLRYHLWPIAATAIGWVLVGRRPVPRIGLAGLALVLLAGGAARLLLPMPPQTYVGMLG